MNSIPRPEYPRPMLVREDNWLNLNGEWEFAFDFGNSGRERKMWSAPSEAYTHKINVPFVPESKLSGIEYVDFIPACWYRRTFAVPAEWQGMDKRILLHFGAVDYYCEVYLNNKKVGNHTGGYTPFTLDITDAVTAGNNSIAVFAEDNGKSDLQPTGKQMYHGFYNKGCHYTRSTGIWQTVWLEYVPKNYIDNLKITPDVNASAVDILVTLEGEYCGIDEVTAAVSFRGGAVVSGKAKVLGKHARLHLPIADPKLWNVGEPNIYDLTFTAGEDSVTSYFGMRDVRINGYAVEINGKPVFQRLVLDQGYYPDGIYTAPTDEDLRKDIELSMAAGFNGARLHMKVFEPRLLYHADRAGYILWGEYPNWGMDESKAEALLSILPEWMDAVRRDYNHPAIVCWCPFNETGAGRNFRLIETVCEMTRSVDPMRPIIDTSGYVHVKTDIYDVHDYTQNPDELREHHRGLLTGEGPIWYNFPHHDMPYIPGQPYFVSEFGGIYWNLDEDHSAAWGYGEAPKTIEEFYERFESLTEVLLDHPKIGGYCYTQLTDVFQEKNGIYAFDRREKFDVTRLNAAQSRVAAVEKREELKD